MRKNEAMPSIDSTEKTMNREILANLIELGQWLRRPVHCVLHINGEEVTVRMQLQTKGEKLYVLSVTSVQSNQQLGSLALEIFRFQTKGEKAVRIVPRVEVRHGFEGSGIGAGLFSQTKIIAEKILEEEDQLLEDAYIVIDDEATPSVDEHGISSAKQREGWTSYWASQMNAHKVIETDVRPEDEWYLAQRVGSSWFLPLRVSHRK